MQLPEGARVTSRVTARVTPRVISRVTPRVISRVTPRVTARVNVNVNVNVVSRTALIRNRVSRRVFHVSKITWGVLYLISRGPNPLASRLRGATESCAIYMAGP